MRSVAKALTVALTFVSSVLLSQTRPPDGPYRVEKSSQVTNGGFGPIFVDSEVRRAYIAREGGDGGIGVLDLDRLEPVGEIPKVSANAIAIDNSTHHGFSASSPAVMWDTRTLTVLKTIDIGDRQAPDSIVSDAANHRIWLFGNRQVIVLDSDTGSIVKTLAASTMFGQAVSDDKGHIFVASSLEGIVDRFDGVKMKLTTDYSLNNKGTEPTGLAFDKTNHILFVTCRETTVLLDSESGAYLGDVPAASFCAGAVFNPKTHECFCSSRRGTLSVIKETSPTNFAFEQSIPTRQGAEQVALDTKTGKLIVAAPDRVPGRGLAGARIPLGRPRNGSAPYYIVTVTK